MAGLAVTYENFMKVMVKVMIIMAIKTADSLVSRFGMRKLDASFSNCDDK